MRKSQTTAEYLIVVAVLIVLALLVIGVLSDIPNYGAKTGQTTSQIKMSSDKVAIAAYSFFDTGAKVTMRNNHVSGVRLYELDVNGEPCLTEDLPIVLMPGESKKISCINVLSSPGEKYSYPIISKWEDVATSTFYDEKTVLVEGTAGISLEPIADPCYARRGSVVLVNDEYILCTSDRHMWTPTLDAAKIPNGLNGVGDFLWQGTGTYSNAQCEISETYPACVACDQLVYAGFSDWTLPSYSGDSSCSAASGWSSCGALWTVFNQNAFVYVDSQLSLKNSSWDRLFASGNDYWTAATVPEAGYGNLDYNLAYVFSMNSATISSSAKSSSAQVRCMR